jgi:FkbM family methyltransferase
VIDMRREFYSNASHTMPPVKRSLTDWVRRAFGGGPADPPQTPATPENRGEIQNRQYDAQTPRVMERVLARDSNCIDVGCHHGMVLDAMLKLAPHGHHHGVEPLPDFHAALRKKYAGNAQVSLHEVALGAEAGETTFQHVVTNPGYSGIRKRLYDRADEQIVEIRVKLARLDDVIPKDQPIRLIKVDVEGGELGVFQGGLELLARSRPFIVFEHGLNAADYYGARPEQVHDLLESCGLKLSLMIDWLEGRPPLARAEFVRQFDERVNFYFLAHP